VLLLITVAGIQHHQWYLVADGGAGMLQFAVIAAMPIPDPREFDISLAPSHDSPSISSHQMTFDRKQRLRDGSWRTYTAEDTEAKFRVKRKEGNLRDVIDVLMELEKYHEKAGAVVSPIFLRGSVSSSQAS
jgi:hypothetical protein